MGLALGVRAVLSWVPLALQPLAGPGEGHPLTPFPSRSTPKAPGLEGASRGECQPCSFSYCITVLKKDGQLWGRTHVPACHRLSPTAPGPGPSVSHPQTHRICQGLTGVSLAVPLSKARGHQAGWCPSHSGSWNLASGPTQKPHVVLVHLSALKTFHAYDFLLSGSLSFYFLKFVFIFVDFWLCLVFIAAKATVQLRYAGFLLQWLL